MGRCVSVVYIYICVRPVSCNQNERPAWMSRYISVSLPSPTQSPCHCHCLAGTAALLTKYAQWRMQNWHRIGSSRADQRRDPSCGRGCAGGRLSLSRCPRGGDRRSPSPHPCNRLRMSCERASGRRVRRRYISCVVSPFRGALTPRFS